MIIPSKMDRFVNRIPMVEASSEPQPKRIPSCVNAEFILDKSKHYDIGAFELCKDCPDDLIYALLSSHCKPDFSKKIFSSKVRENGKVENRSLPPEIFNVHKWLVYSPSQNGLYCIDCALMGRTTTKHFAPGSQNALNLVQQPITFFIY